MAEVYPFLTTNPGTKNTFHLFGCCFISKQKTNSFAWHLVVSLHFCFLLFSISLLLNLAALCVCVCLSFSCCRHYSCFVWFFFCFACAALVASVSIFSQLRSRSQSREGDEQLGEVREEEEAGGGGREGGRRASKEGRLQGGRKEAGGKVDTDKEHQEDLVEKEEDLHQRSISETDLR